jgi:hypothetical protein
MKWILILGAVLLALRLLQPVVRLLIVAFAGARSATPRSANSRMQSRSLLRARIPGGAPTLPTPPPRRFARSAISMPGVVHPRDARRRGAPAQRPGHALIHVPGRSPAVVHARAVVERMTIAIPRAASEGTWL